MECNAAAPPYDLCDRTFQFALRIIQCCDLLNERPGVAWTLSKQLLRSGTSIGANVEEAQAGQSRADFVSKYAIARKEARETKYWLRLVAESTLSDRLVISGLVTECDELIKILTTIIKNSSRT